MPIVELGEVAEFLRNGASIKQSDSAGGTPITRIETIADWKINPERCGYADVAEEDYPDYLLQDGDILISHINSTKHLGKCAIYRGVPEILIHGMNLLGLRVNRKVAYPDYIYRVLGTLDFRRQIPRITKDSVNQSSFTVTNFKTLQIPLPPLEEQLRIAAILDKADALRRKRQQAIDLADQLLRSVFLEMFGDPVTNPKGFKIRCLIEFYINGKDGTKCGPFGSALKKDEYKELGVPVWNMDNISTTGKFVSPAKLWIDEAKYQQLAGYSSMNGDILISRAGTVGKMCVLKSEFEHSIISTNLIRLRLGKELLPIYYVSLMNYCKGRVGRLKTGPDGAFTHMNTGILDKLHFPYPPLELQQKYVKYVEIINKKLTKQIDNLNMLENLFSSLTHHAFRGDLSKRTVAS
jgi:type I restriction enzyme, S subunit